MHYLARANRCTLIDRHILAKWISDFSGDKPGHSPKQDMPRPFVNLVKVLPLLIALAALWLLFRPSITVTHTADVRPTETPVASAGQAERAPTSTAAPPTPRQAIPLTVVHSPPMQTVAVARPVPFRVTTDANLRAGPGTQFEIVGGVRSGAIIHVLPCDEACEWYQVGAREWIAASLVEEISEESHQSQPSTATPMRVEVVLLPTPTFTPVQPPE